MWVRVATFEGVDKAKADALMKERRDSGEMSSPEGMNSVLVLDDVDAKKRKFLAFFDTRESIEAAEAGFEKMGDTIPEDIRGKRTTVHYYEVVVHDGEIDNAKAARVSALEGSPDAIDPSLERTRSETLPKVRAINGNVGAIGLADRESGRISMITLWDSADSLRASEQEADQLRERTAEIGGQKISTVARYEVAFAQSAASTRA